MKCVLQLVFLGGLIGPAQDAPPIRDLIDALTSDSVSERESATAKLKELGPKALPLLKKAAKSTDLEIAARARHLVRVIEISGTLTPTLLHELPGIEERLARGNAEEWCKAYLEAFQKRASSGTLERADLAVLILPAMRGASAESDKVSLCRAVKREEFLEATEELVKWLKDPSVSVRRVALDTIRMVGIREASPHLRPLLLDKSLLIRERALGTLLWLEGRDALPEVMAWLSDPSPSLREEAVSELFHSKFHIPEAVPRLIELAQSESSTPALYAGMLAVHYSEPEEQARILNVLRTHPKSEVREHSVHQTPVESLRDILPLAKDPSADVRGSVAFTLGHKLAEWSVPVLLKLAEDPDADVRYRAAAALHELRAVETLPCLARLLKDEDLDVRLAAAAGLGDIGSEDTADLLLPLLKDKEEKLFWQALESLVALEPREHLPGILRGIRDRTPVATTKQDEVLRQLGAMCEKRHGPEILELLRSKQPETCIMGLVIASRVAFPEIVAKVRALLKDPSVEERVRSFAFISLCRLDPEPFLEKFRPKLREPNPGVHRIFLRLVQEEGIRAAARDLIPLAKGSEDDVRRTSIKMLGILKATEAGETLLGIAREGALLIPTLEALHRLRHPEVMDLARSLLGHQDPRVRSLAVDTLGDYPEANVAPLVRPLLRDPIWAVRRAAINFLVRRGDPSLVPELKRILARARPREMWHALRGLRLLRADGILEDARAVLRQRGSYEVKEAALIVAQHGELEGVRALNRLGNSFRDALNAVRNPSAFERLDRAHPPGARYAGSRMEVLRALVEEAGLELELPEGRPARWHAYMKEDRPRVLPRRGLSTLFESMMDLIYTQWMGIILEKERVRIVPRAEANRFWSGWLSRYRKKEK